METLILPIPSMMTFRALSEEVRPLGEDEGFLALLQQSRTMLKGETEGEKKSPGEESLPVLVLPSVPRPPEMATLPFTGSLLKSPSEHSPRSVLTEEKGENVCGPLLLPRSSSTNGIEVTTVSSLGRAGTSSRVAIAAALNPIELKGSPSIPLDEKVLVERGLIPSHSQPFTASHEAPSCETPKRTSFLETPGHDPSTGSPDFGVPGHGGLEEKGLLPRDIPVMTDPFSLVKTAEPRSPLISCSKADLNASLFEAPEGGSNHLSSSSNQSRLSPEDMPAEGTIRPGDSTSGPEREGIFSDPPQSGLKQPVTSPPLLQEGRRNDGLSATVKVGDRSEKGSASRFTLFEMTLDLDGRDDFSPDLRAMEMKEGLQGPKPVKGSPLRLSFSSTGRPLADPFSSGSSPHPSPVIRRVGAFEIPSFLDRVRPFVPGDGEYPQILPFEVDVPDDNGLGSIPTRGPYLDPSMKGRQECEVSKTCPDSSPLDDPYNFPPPRAKESPPMASPEQEPKAVGEESRNIPESERGRVSEKNEEVAFFEAMKPEGAPRQGQVPETKGMDTEAGPRGYTVSLAEGQAHEICEQVAARLITTAGGKVERVRFRLEPPSLGFVDVEIKRERDGIKATLWADQGMTKELLEKHQFELRTMLESDGLRLEQFDVLLKQDGGSYRERDPLPVGRQPWQERNGEEKSPEERSLGGQGTPKVHHGRGWALGALDVIV